MDRLDVHRIERVMAAHRAPARVFAKRRGAWWAALAWPIFPNAGLESEVAMALGAENVSIRARGLLARIKSE